MPGSRNVDIQLFLNANCFSPFQWTVFALCFSIVLLDGFDTAAIGFIAPSLVTEWGIPRPALAPVLSAALFGLAAGALFTGPLADRFGRKLVLIFSVLVFGIASLGSAFSTDLTMLTAFRPARRAVQFHSGRSLALSSPWPQPSGLSARA